MGKTKDLKRENFDVSPEQQAEIETLQALVEAPITLRPRQGKAIIYL